MASYHHRTARALWRAHYGPIPLGHHIHHRDGHPENNALANLECKPAFQHLSDHGRIVTPAKLANLDAVRPMAAAWHGSDAGHAWHVVHGRATWADREPVDRVCAVCGVTFADWTHRASVRFCGNNCKAAWRRRSRVDDVERICRICGTAFRASRYSITRCCSRQCGARARFLPGGDRAGL